MTEKLKPTIKIWDSIGLGLIVSYPTGILVSNQTGGTACLQSTMEGFYLPIGNDLILETNQLTSPEIDLREYFTSEKHSGNGTTEGIDIADVNAITKILCKYSLNDFIQVDPDKMKKSHEAWIYVLINNNCTLLDNLEQHLTGVISWSNSD